MWNMKCTWSYHNIRLSEKSKQYCGISFFGTASYLYQRMPMNLDIIPALWQLYMSASLDNFNGKKIHQATMDNLLIHSTKKAHRSGLDEFVKALLKNPLHISISPNKFHLFRTKLKYMYR